MKHIISLIVILISLMMGSCGKEEEETPPQIPVITVKTGWILPYTLDFCTTPDEVACYSEGGLVEYMSDGTINFITYSFFYIPDIHDLWVGERITARGESIPAYMQIFTYLLSEKIDRGEGNRNLYLVYKRPVDRFYLIHDTNGNGIVEVEDEVLQESEAGVN